MRLRSHIGSCRPGADRQQRQFSVAIEALEIRSLLSTTAVVFQLPPGLAAASRGGNPTPALFASMVGSLQAQIETQAPRDDAPQQLTSTVNLLVNQYEADAARLFAASRPGLNTLLQFQGEATRSAINSYKAQLDTGLIARTSYFNEDVFLVIQEMTLSRKVWPVGTPLQEYLVLSDEANQGLDALVLNLNTPGPGQLSDAAADAVVHAESYAYQTEVLLGSTRSPLITNTVTLAVGRLVSHVDAAVGQSDFTTQVQAAEQTFKATLVDPSGLFGSHGTLGRFIKQPPSVPDPLRNIDDVATFANLQYREVKTTAPVVVYRSFSVLANLRGRFLSTQLFATAAQAVRRQALDLTWYNTNAATFVADVTIPKDYTIYVGKVAAIYQGIFERQPVPSLYPGGATQVVVLNSRDSALVYSNLRATGT